MTARQREKSMNISERQPGLGDGVLRVEGGRSPAGGGGEGTRPASPS